MDNLHIFKFNIPVILTAYVIFLLIMFFWFASSWFHDRGGFGLERLLGKQIGNCYFSLVVMFSAYMVIRVYMGVIWLLVTTIAEVLPGPAASG